MRLTHSSGRACLVGIAVVGALLLSGCGATRVAGSIAGSDTTGALGSQAGVEPGGFVATIHDFGLARQVLTRRAQAVLHHDQAAFMRTIDPDDPSFRSRELIVYQNLQKLPVTSLSYVAGTSGLTPAAVPGDDPTLAPEVSEHIELQGVDTVPVVLPVDMTFVRRGTSWYLGTDTLDTTDSTRPVSRPWEGPPIAVSQHGPLLVVAEATPAGVAQHIGAVVLADLRRDAQVLGIPVDLHVLVDLTTGGQLSHFGDNEEAAGVTYPVFGSDTIAGWRIKVNPDELSQLASYPQLLRHELTHYLLRDINVNDPTWLVEGIAQYVAYSPNPVDALTLPTNDYQQLVHRPRQLLESGFFGNDPPLDYAEASATVIYLVQTGGMAKLIELMKAYHSPQNIDQEPDSLSNSLLEQLYGLSATQVADGAFQVIEGTQ